MSWTWSGNRLTFHWPTGTGIGDNFTDLWEGIREAAQWSQTTSDTARLIIPGYDEPGYVEARTTKTRQMPVLPTAGIESLIVLSQSPYYLLQGPRPSVYYGIQIPGLLTLVDENLLAVNLAYSSYLSSIFNTVFNCYGSSVIFQTCPPNLTAYLNMPRTLANITKKPRIPKLIDFTPIFTALFGEKIATVILKEIK